jgi:hypothetical protein
VIRRIGLLWLGATAVVSGIVGVIAYQAGWGAGVTARLPEGAAVPYYAYGPHFGFFGFVPFLFVLLVLFLVFRGGRRWSRFGPPPPAQAARTGQPPAGDPWQDWPERPASEPQPAPPQQK